MPRHAIAALMFTLAASACVAEAPADLAEGPGVWRLVGIDGEPPGAVVLLAFPRLAEVEGRGPCNRYGGPVTINGEDILFGPMRATKMACPDLALESRYFDALSKVTKMEKGPAMLTLSGPGVRLDFVTPMN